MFAVALDTPMLRKISFPFCFKTLLVHGIYHIKEDTGLFSFHLTLIHSYYNLRKISLYDLSKPSKEC